MRLSFLALALTVAVPALADTVEVKTTPSSTHVLMPGNGLVSFAVDLAAGKAESTQPLPMNIALVIDRSGSMLGEKMEQTRAAAAAFVKKLGEKDTLAIISYSDDVRVDLPASRVTAQVRNDALAAIEGLQAAGSTNLSGGLFRGQDEVDRNLAVGQVNRVILMSDGIANRGVTDTKQIAQAAQKGAQRGISVTTMGVGTDYAEDLMTAVADHGSGNYYFIEDAKAVAGVLTTELNRMFSTVAQGTTLTIRLDDGTNLIQVFGYTFTRQGDLVTIPLAELFGGQRRSILFEVEVPVVREGRLPVASVTLGYQDIRAGGKHIESSSKLDITVTRNKDLVDSGKNKSVLERIEEIRAATIMTQAADLVRDGRTEEAKDMVRRESTRLRASGAAMGGSGRVTEQAEALDKLQYDFDDAAAAPATIKATKAKAYELAK